MAQRARRARIVKRIARAVVAVYRTRGQSWRPAITTREGGVWVLGPIRWWLRRLRGRVLPIPVARAAFLRLPFPPSLRTVGPARRATAARGRIHARGGVRAVIVISLFRAAKLAEWRSRTQGPAAVPAVHICLPPHR